MSAKHTPGEWAVTSSKGEVHCQSRNDQNWIAREIPDCPAAPPLEERQANARLIAAAPDLLEAASEAMDLAAYLTDYATLSGGEMAEKYGEDPSDGFNNIISRVKRVQRIGMAAITKATGGGQ